MSYTFLLNNLKLIKNHKFSFYKKLNLSRKLNLDVNTNVAKDVILYKYENPTFFKTLNIFALCQFGFWAYLSHFALTTLRDAPVDKTNESQAWWRKINLGENKYRYGLTIISFVIGYGILGISWAYTLRSVRYLILRKGGQEATLVVYAPFGKNRMMTVDLKNLSAFESRESARVHLPIKVQNRAFYFILDMRGQFLNGKLFDQTVGVKRTLKNL